MNKETKEFANYFYETYIDSVIFNFNDLKIISDDTDVIKSTEFITALINKLKKMNEGSTYPSNVLINLKGLIKRVSPYINSDTNKIINDEFKKILFKKMGSGIYTEEYNKRFMEPEEVTKNILYLEKSDINNSIVFDFVVLYLLIIDLDAEVRKSDYYLYSIKAIINDYPTIFIDSTIKKRTLEIISKQDDSELKERLIYKVNNIKKFINKKTDYSYIKRVYKFLLVQNMLIDKDILNENIEDMDFLIDTLKYIIDNKLISNKFEQNNALTMIDSYRNSGIKNFPEDKKSIIDETNEYIIKTNSIEPNNKKRATENYMRFGNIGIKGMIDNFSNTDILIKNDLRVMTYLLTGKNQGIYLDDAYLSIRKILFLCPSLFDNQKVYERTESLLELNNNKKELKKVKRIYQG